MSEAKSQSVIRGDHPVDRAIQQYGASVIQTGPNMLVRCRFGHEFATTPAEVTSAGQICAECSVESDVRFAQLHVDMEELLTGISPRRVDRFWQVTFKCDRGHQFAQDIGDVPDSCPGCIVRRPAMTLEAFEEVCRAKYGDTYMFLMTPSERRQYASLANDSEPDSDCAGWNNVYSDDDLAGYDVYSGEYDVCSDDGQSNLYGPDGNPVDPTDNDAWSVGHFQWGNESESQED